MKKKLIILLAFVCCNIGFTQQNLSNIKGRKAYTTLKSYIELYGNNFTKNDSLNFIIRENDTLVLLQKHQRMNGVTVPYEPKDSTFLEIYKDIVYKKYTLKESSKKRKSYMRLWSGPIKMFFSKSVDEKYKKVLTSLALEITKEIDSLHISVVTDLEKSNYIVYQIDKIHSYKYSNNLGKNKYVSYYSYWNKGKIYSTKLEINVSKHKNKRVNSNYITQSFIKSLGHFSTTSKLPCRSIFSDCNSGRKQFTKEDLEVLKYHYSYGICKFTDLKTFENNHKKAKEIFSKTGNHLKFMHEYQNKN